MVWITDKLIMSTNYKFQLYCIKLQHLLLVDKYANMKH